MWRQRQQQQQRLCYYSSRRIAAAAASVVSATDDIINIRSSNKAAAASIVCVCINHIGTHIYTRGGQTMFKSSSSSIIRCGDQSSSVPPAERGPYKSNSTFSHPTYMPGAWVLAKTVCRAPGSGGGCGGNAAAATRRRQCEQIAALSAQGQWISFEAPFR